MRGFPMWPQNGDLKDCRSPLPCKELGNSVFSCRSENVKAWGRDQLDEFRIIERSCDWNSLSAGSLNEVAKLNRGLAESRPCKSFLRVWFYSECFWKKKGFKMGWYGLFYVLERSFWLYHAEQMGRGWKRSRRALKRELIHCLELVLAWVMMVWQKGKE